MNKKPIVINLIGGPGVGKSTLAAKLFSTLKEMGYNCEMALEFAKDKVWEESFKTMDDQIYIFAKQFHKLWRLRDKVDVIITDSPLIMSIYYMKEPSVFFDRLVIEQFNKFDNLTYLIDREGDYHREGRLQTEDEAKQIDLELKNLMDRNGIDFTIVKRSSAENRIVKDVNDSLKLVGNDPSSLSNVIPTIYDFFQDMTQRTNQTWVVDQTQSSVYYSI